MAGISEALVATAVGLMVAIPAVVGFNYFNRRVRQTLANVDALAHVVLAQLKGEGDAPAAAEKTKMAEVSVAGGSTHYDDDEGGQGAITDINVTPLVDITLVLLIIFMVTAPMIVNNPSIKVELPKAATRRRDAQVDAGADAVSASAAAATRSTPTARRPTSQGGRGDDSRHAGEEQGSAGDHRRRSRASPTATSCTSSTW